MDSSSQATSGSAGFPACTARAFLPSPCVPSWRRLKAFALQAGKPALPGALRSCVSFLPACSIVGPDAPATRTAFILHGIFAAARSWRTFASQLAARVPGWRFVLVDLRNHGGSMNAPPPHTLLACVGDL